MHHGPELKTQSCKSYTNAIKTIADRYGMPVPAPERGRTRREDLEQLVDRIVMLECERAAREAVVRVFRLVVDHLSAGSAADLYIPRTCIRINEGGIGELRIGPLNSNYSRP